jgi:DNA-directed RNA polymerase III subunit RPC1
VWRTGYIELRMPVFHIGFFKQTLSVLSCICKTCSRVLLSESESARFYKAFRRCD